MDNHIKAFQRILDGLRELPDKVIVVISLDDYTTVTVRNMDEDGKKQFHITIQQDCDNGIKESVLVSDHDNDLLAHALAGNLKAAMF